MRRLVGFFALFFLISPTTAKPNSKLVAPPPLIRKEEAPAAPDLLTSNDHKSLLLVGELTKGSASTFVDAIRATPSIKTIVLQSNGGSLAEALKIADVVRHLKLNTLVERTCVSACTVILLAGHDRAASSTARVGFHRPIFPQAKAEELPTLLSWARSYYDNAGVSPTFTDKAFATPNESVWYPSVDELQSAHVLTRVSLGGETTATFSTFKTEANLETTMESIAYWRAMKARHPEITTEVLDASWKAKMAGATDNDVMAAGRAILSKHLPDLLRSAPDDILVDYLGLVGDQMKAARAVSFEACERATDGTLDPIAVFPKSVIDREMATLVRAVEADPVHEVPDEQAALRILKPLYLSLPEDQLAAVAKPSSETVSARCNGMVALYEQINSLDSHSRAVVSRWLFGTK
jgi:hypothetical protein